MGAEVIHLGHNRSALEIVEAAIEEDAHGIAITSYQGGHIEFFSYIKDLLNKNDCGHIKIFGGGGGTILPKEIDALHAYGIERIYSPDDGRKLGLEGMIADVIQRCDFSIDQPYQKKSRSVGVSKRYPKHCQIYFTCRIRQTKINQPDHNNIPVLGITGTGGAGKSTITDEIVRRFLETYTNKTIAVISVDPSKRKPAVPSWEIVSE